MGTKGGIAQLKKKAEGGTIEEISAELEVSTATVSRRLSYLRHNEGTLTKYRELQHLRVSDLSAKVLDSLEEDLPNMNPDQRIKLLGVLTRSEAQFKDRGIPKEPSLFEMVIQLEEDKIKEEERLKKEAIEIENLSRETDCKG